MSDSEPEEVAIVLEAMQAEVEADLRRGVPMLSGPCVVSLSLDVEEAATPMEAVGKVVQHLARAGLDSVYFAVLDRSTGEEYAVRAGQLIPIAQVSAEAEENDDSADT